MKNILISLCLALFIISASVTITLNFRPLYYHDISSLQIEETSGFSKKVIRENYDALIDYNQFFYSGKLKLTLPMSREGKIHFEEVKRIFVGIEYLCVITLILSCFLIKRKIRSRNIDFLRSASIITVLLPVIVGILCAFNWDAAFTLFHEIMFRNDYWIFDEATDHDPSRCIFLSLRRYDHLTDLNWQLTLYGISFFFSTQVYAIMDRY